MHWHPGGKQGREFPPAWRALRPSSMAPLSLSTSSAQQRAVWSLISHLKAPPRPPKRETSSLEPTLPSTVLLASFSFAFPVAGCHHRLATLIVPPFPPFSTMHAPCPGDFSPSCPCLWGTAPAKYSSDLCGLKTVDAS